MLFEKNEAGEKGRCFCAVLFRILFQKAVLVNDKKQNKAKGRFTTTSYAGL
jgi:hypothetical protein